MSDWFGPFWDSAPFWRNVTGSLLIVFVSGLPIALWAVWRIRSWKNMAKTDPLTGLANRRVFEEILDYTLSIATRESTPLSILMIDVDNFKLVNDSIGHPGGDKALRDIAELMRGTISRDTDLLSRLHGDEFAAILPGTNSEGALDVAEATRTVIEALVLPSDLRVTLSVGVMTVYPRPQAPLKTEEVMKRADTALYQAKRIGKNRVYTISEGVPSKGVERL
jgi:diguanylate cyclase (GGDEF)-like protein